MIVGHYYYHCKENFLRLVSLCSIERGHTLLFRIGFDLWFVFLAHSAQLAVQNERVYSITCDESALLPHWMPQLNNLLSGRKVL